MAGGGSAEPPTPQHQGWEGILPSEIPNGPAGLAVRGTKRPLSAQVRDPCCGEDEEQGGAALGTGWWQCLVFVSEHSSSQGLAQLGPVSSQQAGEGFT